jgi:hypothetical protein
MANPGPFLNQQFLLLAIGLEVDGGDDFVADEHGQREVAMQPFIFGDISLEAVAIVKEKLKPFSLNDQRIERRQ